MRTYLFIICFVGALSQRAVAQQVLPNYDRILLLDEKVDTTANISLGDLDGDGHLDILLAKGRHWPIVDKILLGDGKGGIRKAYDLGKVADRSFSGCLADFNGDGFLDIAISNDNPDPKLVYLNDGKGNFSIGSEFGLPTWDTRNASVADVNRDGLPDIIVANRGNASSVNYVCLNRGKGKFDSNCIPFAQYPATTISPADINHDGFVDLVVPHRDGGQSYVYLGGSDVTFPDTRRIPFGPADARIRMAAVADLNGDSLLDIVTIDETKGVDIYFGQKDNTFSAGISIAGPEIVPYALTIADLNKDGKMDIIVGHVEAPSSVFFNDGTGRHYTEVHFGDSKGTVYGFSIGDFDEDGKLDIAAGRSDAPSVLYFGGIAPKK
jgi:hypothetical protein